MLYPPFKFVFECPSFPLPILNIFDRFSSVDMEEECFRIAFDFLSNN